jgi:energy-coupling factor transporter transmembrane protein EcfT
MLILLSIWLAVGVALMSIGKGQPSAGLPLAYFLGLSLIHAPGAMLYLGSEEGGSTAAVMTQAGFEETVIGLVAFLLAVVIARLTASGRRAGARRLHHPTPASAQALDRLSLLYIAIGGASYFLLMPLLGGIATVTAVVSSLGALIMVGLCLRLWLARETRNRQKSLLTIAVISLLPLVTVVQGGFIGFGMMWVIAIGSFFFAQARRRLAYFVLAPVFLFVGLSLFVNYMAARGDIRQLVWYQQVGIGDRLQRVADVFLNFEWFDASNEKHRSAIDGRLNQNFLVGVAEERLESGRVKYASGASAGELIIALVPRAIWPGKPAVGGGGSLVQDFTGVKFAEGTSVGAGQVLEFYANFGTLGVIGGFLIYGWLIGRIDVRIIRSLREGDQSHFLFWFLIGLALLQPGGNLREIVVSAASSAFAGYGIGRLMLAKRSAADYGHLPQVAPD